MRRREQKRIALNDDHAKVGRIQIRLTENIDFARGKRYFRPLWSAKRRRKSMALSGNGRGVC